MAIYTSTQLVSASNATYTTNGAGDITGATVRALNLNWISSSVLLYGNNLLSGSQVITGSLKVVGTDGSETTIAKNYNLISTINAPGVDAYAQVYSSEGNSAGNYIGALKADFTVDVEHAMLATTNSITFNDWDNNGGFYVPYFSIAPNVGNNPIPQMIRGLGITGSVAGNVTPVTVSSNTASINLASGNFFTVTLANNATTFFNFTNVKPGVTANLILTTGTVSTASFSSNVKQPSGSPYLPSSGSGKIDALTVVSVDASNLYLVSAKTFI